MWVYLDQAATATCKVPDQEIDDGCMLGNPSSLHLPGVRAFDKLEAARKEIAQLIGAQPGEIYFTSGGTESNNWAIKGAAYANQGKGRHIITTAIEHPSVLESCRFLEENDFEVTYIKPQPNGSVAAKDVLDAIRDDTILVSVMALNNEIGTFQPYIYIGKQCRERGVLFHTDAVQLTPHEKVDMRVDKIDMMSVSGHKFGAPVGTGFLYIREGTNIIPLLHGGGQEGGLRSGTESVELATKLAASLKDTYEHMEERDHNTGRLRDLLYSLIMTDIPDAKLNGDYLRVSNNLNMCFPGVHGEMLAYELGNQGIYVSTGSACSSFEDTPSHVLTAIGLSLEDAMSSIRITLPHDLDSQSIHYVAKTIIETVRNLRAAL